ncbi:MAG: 6-carboxytetrahydropterin synthase QueD [Desulfovibrio sp.]|jgi:6-pyruvoyltetrahydropterin/6-carboxytetrahydropterin synthase|nr:6-carboxytetrahydropterin synthase QueD [Desulfovibrio sp.]
MTAFWRLAVRDEFSAAHALRGYGGKCEGLHGHNFAVELTVEGSGLAADTGMLLDFSILKSLLKEILAGLDHRVLNETPPFDALNPSSENLARHVWRAAAERLATHPGSRAGAVRLHSVSVAEKGAQNATYMEMPETAEPRP